MTLGDLAQRLLNALRAEGEGSERDVEAETDGLSCLWSGSGPRVDQSSCSRQAIARADVEEVGVCTDAVKGNRQVALPGELEVFAKTLELSVSHRGVPRSKVVEPGLADPDHWRPIEAGDELCHGGRIGHPPGMDSQHGEGSSLLGCRDEAIPVGRIGGCDDPSVYGCVAGAREHPLEIRRENGEVEMGVCVEPPRVWCANGHATSPRNGSTPSCLQPLVDRPRTELLPSPR